MCPKNCTSRTVPAALTVASKQRVAGSNPARRARQNIHSYEDSTSVAPGRPGDEELGWADPGPPLWASLSVSSEPLHATQIGKICAANIAHRGRSFTARRLRGGIDLGRRGLVG